MPRCALFLCNYFLISWHIAFVLPHRNAAVKPRVEGALWYLKNDSALRCSAHWPRWLKAGCRLDERGHTGPAEPGCAESPLAFYLHSLSLSLFLLLVLIHAPSNSTTRHVTLLPASLTSRDSSDRHGSRALLIRLCCCHRWLALGLTAKALEQQSFWRR